MNTLYQALTSRSFVADRRRARLHRTFSLGADVIWVHTAKQGADNRILATWVYLGIHIEAVERVLERWHPVPGAREALSPVLTTTLHNLAPAVTPKVWLTDTNSEHDVEQQIASLIESVLTRGLPFLEQFHDLNTLLNTLLDKSAHSLALAGGRDAWAMKVLVLWFLLGKAKDPVATAQVVSECRQLFAGDDSGLVTFETRLAQLTKESVS
ncbi:hypothetical protein [Deinococcus humi]|uniref:Uncharacterized protein n=1 Tax=Deinococcus humi TaxID=662880 RepID=A0A7W8K2K3_9DEIO|nr:hypothetical protein [Deinococcus humi]MBB5366356.1 hypothetical protein [Deinococcus humi]